MKGFQEFWHGLTSIQKMVFVIISLIVLWFLITTIKSRMSVVKNQIENKSEVQILKEKGVQPSYTYDKYAGWSDELDTAMRGGGTDEDRVFRIFGYMNNDMDFIQLYKAFGVRDGEDLNGWLKGDLSATDIAKLNKQLNYAGITKRIT